MERLICSSSLPSKLHLKSFPSIPQHGRVDPRKLGLLLPPTTTTDSFRVISSALKRYKFQLRASCLPNPIYDPSVHGSSFDPSNSNGSSPEPRILSHTSSNLQKAVAAAKIILLSALAMTIMLPVRPLPAVASLQTASATGGAVARGFLRTEVLSSAWTGFFAGCLHTLSGPDHLAALAPLSIGRTKMESAAVGALWGCGHDAGQLIFGLLFLLLKDRLHIEIIRTWGTRVVGVTLLVIGAMGIKEASEVPTPCVALENGECDVGVLETVETPLVAKKKKIGFATFATGIVHGLQPDALMMVLPALALPSRLAGAAFLGMFLVGTVVAMGGYTVFIGSCSEALKDRVPRITEKLTWAASLVAIGLGLAIIISQFFGFSLY